MRADIARAFREQADHCRNLGSPFNGLVCDLLAERLDDSSEFGRRISAWQGAPVADALALRAAGALHALARSGRAPVLAALYPKGNAIELPSAAVLGSVIEETVSEHDALLCPYLDSPPQTNEVARSSILLGAALWIAQRTGLALDWHEIGASAGLNLAFDHYRYELGAATFGPANAPVTIRASWQGKLPPLGAALRVHQRAGCDKSPLDPSSPAQRERLLSYIWPDQSERLQRTAAALELAARAPYRVERASASAWVRAHFSAPLRPGAVRVLGHTIVWQYLPRTERDAVRAAVEEAGARAVRDAQVAWFGMEADEVRDGAGLRLTLWPGGKAEPLGRADFHGRWVRWS
jgi:hypothetical protein